MHILNVCHWLLCSAYYRLRVTPPSCWTRIFRISPISFDHRMSDTHQRYYFHHNSTYIGNHKECICVCSLLQKRMWKGARRRLEYGQVRICLHLVMGKVCCTCWLGNIWISFAAYSYYLFDVQYWLWLSEVGFWWWVSLLFVDYYVVVLRRGSLFQGAIWRDRCYVLFYFLLSANEVCDVDFCALGLYFIVVHC